MAPHQKSKSPTKNAIVLLEVHHIDRCACKALKEDATVSTGSWFREEPLCTGVETNAQSHNCKAELRHSFASLSGHMHTSHNSCFFIPGPSCNRVGFCTFLSESIESSHSLQD
ncbi:hypothetical protein XENORESO_010336 [Xenotaenia resolanae]|uniref:Uncharacterized protein n=1 Tax=Xenotaenia resolanae TaxID=208358 RepID=A0ABV0W944_9TELE